MSRRRLALLVATGGGIGRLRPAPGTWASLAASLAAALWLRFGPPSCWIPVLVAVVLAALLAGLRSVPVAVAHFGRPDPPPVVIDELAGQWLVFAGFNAVVAGPDDARFWWYCAAACGAFRLFDVAKPWPVRPCERLPGAWGVMVDDLVAGVLATGACHLLKALARGAT